MSFAPCGLVRPLPRRRRMAGSMRLSSLPIASATMTVTESVPVGSVAVNSQVNTASATASAASATVPLKPASDVVAGAVARAASQSTIHPLDTLKVRLQTSGVQSIVNGGLQSVTSLYKGVAGAATGAGIALGAYFACYGIACNTLSRTTNLSPSAIAFVGGGIAAAGSSVVKVPIAVCIRSVQAGVYPNALVAARSIVSAAGPRGLFTGYAPTLIEDIPDMAFKFAMYETLKQMHSRAVGGRAPTMAEDFALGATSGAFAAAATTPLDVIKTNMMCTAASRPTMLSSARTVYAEGGTRAFLRGIGPRAISNGVNSAVFFAFFEAIRKAIKEREYERVARVAALAEVEKTAPSGGYQA